MLCCIWQADTEGDRRWRWKICKTSQRTQSNRMKMTQKTQQQHTHTKRRYLSKSHRHNRHSQHTVHAHFSYIETTHVTIYIKITQKTHQHINSIHHTAILVSSVALLLFALLPRYLTLPSFYSRLLHQNCPPRVLLCAQNSARSLHSTPPIFLTSQSNSHFAFYHIMKYLSSTGTNRTHIK